MKRLFICIGILSIFLAILVLRTGVYATRVIREYIQSFNGSVPEHLGYIQPCTPLSPNATREEIQLWQYRNLGVSCKE